MTDLELYEEIVLLEKRGEPFAVVTVVATTGSSPRKAGAKMVVRHDGTTIGTVGGGRMEVESVEAALASLADAKPLLLPFVLTEEHGFVCGGSVTVYIEPHGLRPALVMVGGGHVGKEVTELAARCGFRVTVVDSRPEMATTARHPGAIRAVWGDEGEALRNLPIRGTTTIIIAAYSHKADYAAVREALRTDSGCIGLLGSRRKWVLFRERLLSEGFTEDDLSRVVTPVGLDLGSETPEEIAVSIVGQLIENRRKHASAGIGHSAGGRPLDPNGDLQAAAPAPG